MSVTMAEIKGKVDSLDGKVDEQKGRVDEHEGLLDIHSSKIRGLEQWKDGNGAKGAEARLQCVEEVVVENRSAAGAIINDDIVKRIGMAAAEHIKLSARDRDKSFSMKARAIAPYFIALLNFIAAIAAIIYALNGGGQ
jgi:hypothetical protein